MFFLALIYLAFISLGLPDSLLGSSWPIIYTQLGVPVGSAGYVSATIAAGTIVSSLLSHWIIDRLGTGKVTVISVALTAFALLGFALTPSFLWLIVFAIPLGLGAGAVDAGLNHFVAEHYAAKHMNWLHCAWGVGAMLGPIVIATLTSSGYGWRSSYGSISIIQLVLVGILLISLPMWGRVASARQTEVPSHIEPQLPKAGIFASLRLKGVKLAMLTFFLLTTIESCFILWGASYLVNGRGVSPESAAGWIALFFLGMTIGRGLSGFISIKLSNEALIRLGSALSISGLIILMLPLPTLFALVALLVVGLGISPIFPSMLHQTPVYFSKRNAQATIGLQMASAYTASTLMPPPTRSVFCQHNFPTDAATTSLLRLWVAFQFHTLAVCHNTERGSLKTS